jgi:predicted lipoprotein with Yx(FWY)xxD motif
MRKISTIALFIAGAVLIVAGCGSDNNDSSGAYGGKGGATTTSTSPEKAGAAAVVSAANNPKLGMIIVTAEGHTLYDFHKDQGGKSACYGACAGAWPPLTTDGAPKAEKGAESSQLGTTKRKDGTMQVTYAGHPLYTYVGDAKPGDVTGNDIDQFGAEWYALQPSGEEPED